MIFLLAALCVLATVAATPESQRHMLLTVVASTQKQFELLSHAAENDFELDFWTHPLLNGYTDVMVPARRFQLLQQQWRQAGITIDVKQEDVEDFVDKIEEKNRQLRQLNLRASDTNLGHNYYRSYQEFTDDIRRLRDIFGPDLVRFDESGTIPYRERTHEGRIIHVVEIGRRFWGRDGQQQEKPIIMLEVNIHAREWITGAATFYMMDWLLTNYARDYQASNLLDNYDLVIVPIANPDGFEFSRSNSSTRMWRKNRRPINWYCVGVDLNRNFDGFWQSYPYCNSDSYPGERWNSEPETRAIVNIFYHYEKTMVMYFAVHSYSQMLLLPWASQNAIEPADNMHKELGQRMADAMTGEYGRYHRSGTLRELLHYTAAGSTMDWTLNAKRGGSSRAHRNDKFLSLAYELRPEAGLGFPGFALDANHIIPTGHELMTSLFAATSYYNDIFSGENEE